MCSRGGRLPARNRLRRRENSTNSSAAKGWSVLFARALPCYGVVYITPWPSYSQPILGRSQTIFQLAKLATNMERKPVDVKRERDEGAARPSSAKVPRTTNVIQEATLRKEGKHFAEGSFRFVYRD